MLRCSLRRDAHSLFRLLPFPLGRAVVPKDRRALSLGGPCGFGVAFCCRLALRRLRRFLPAETEEEGPSTIRLSRGRRGLGACGFRGTLGWRLLLLPERKERTPGGRGLRLLLGLRSRRRLGGRLRSGLWRRGWRGLLLGFGLLIGRSLPGWRRATEGEQGLRRCLGRRLGIRLLHRFGGRLWRWLWRRLCGCLRRRLRCWLWRRLCGCLRRRLRCWLRCWLWGWLWGRLCCSLWGRLSGCLWGRLSGCLWRCLWRRLGRRLGRRFRGRLGSCFWWSGNASQGKRGRRLRGSIALLRLNCLRRRQGLCGWGRGDAGLLHRLDEDIRLGVAGGHRLIRLADGSGEQRGHGLAQSSGNAQVARQAFRVSHATIHHGAGRVPKAQALLVEAEAQRFGSPVDLLSAGGDATHGSAKLEVVSRVLALSPQRAPDPCRVIEVDSPVGGVVQDVVAGERRLEAVWPPLEAPLVLALVERAFVRRVEAKVSRQRVRVHSLAAGQERLGKAHHDGRLERAPPRRRVLERLLRPLEHVGHELQGRLGAQDWDGGADGGKGAVVAAEPAGGPDLPIHDEVGGDPHDGLPVGVERHAVHLWRRFVDSPRGREALAADAHRLGVRAQRSRGEPDLGQRRAPPPRQPLHQSGTLPIATVPLPLLGRGLPQGGPPSCQQGRQPHLVAVHVIHPHVVHAQLQVWKGLPGAQQRRQLLHIGVLAPRDRGGGLGLLDHARRRPRLRHGATCVGEGRQAQARATGVSCWAIAQPSKQRSSAYPRNSAAAEGIAARRSHGSARRGCRCATWCGAAESAALLHLHYPLRDRRTLADPLGSR
eukprot:scaffold70_cov242-Pinguiococcus_pyrenoidosus.AAC.3